MSLSELRVARELRGATCIPFKIPNSEVNHFQEFASSKSVDTKVKGVGKEMSTIYVCTNPPDKEGKIDLNPLKEFIKSGVPIFVAEENSPKPQQSAA